MINVSKFEIPEKECTGHWCDSCGDVTTPGNLVLYQLSFGTGITEGLEVNLCPECVEELKDEIKKL